MIGLAYKNRPYHGSKVTGHDFKGQKNQTIQGFAISYNKRVDTIENEKNCEISGSDQRPKSGRLKATIISLNKDSWDLSRFVVIRSQDKMSAALVNDLNLVKAVNAQLVLLC